MIKITFSFQQRSAKSDPESQHLGTSFPLSASHEPSHTSCWDASKGPDDDDDNDDDDSYDDCGCQDCKSFFWDRGGWFIHDAQCAQCTKKVLLEHFTLMVLMLLLSWWWDGVTISFCLQRFRGLYDSSSNSGFESSSDLRDILIAAVDFSIHKVCTVIGVVIVVIVNERSIVAL